MRSSRIKLATSFFLFAVSSQILLASAHAGWEQTPFPVFNAQAFAIAPAPSQSGRVYVGLVGLGTYRSDNHGGTWSRASTGIPPDRVVRSLVVSPTNADEVWVGLSGGYFPSLHNEVCRTTNGGALWVVSPIGGLIVEDLLIHAADPSILLASVSYEAPGLYRSTDSGATWTHIVEIPNVGDLSTHPATPEVILAGTGNGVIRSTDGGIHWSPAVSLPPSNPESFPGLIGDQSYVVAFAPSDPNRAYATRGDPSEYFHYQTIQVSTDAGATFKDVSAWLRNVKALAVHPSNPNELFAVAIELESLEVVVSRSTDSGVTWSNVYVSPSLAQPTDLQFDPADPNHLYVTQGFSQSGGGIAHSNAGGVPGSWVTSVNGISNYPVYQMGGDYIGTNFVFLDSRLYRSFRDLSTWTLLPSIGIEFQSWCFEVPSASLAQPMWDLGDVVQGDVLTRYLHRSTDWGLTWWPVGSVPPGIPDASATAVYANHGGGSVVYVTTTGQLYRSVDGGWSYVLVNSSTIYDPKIVVQPPANALRLYMTGFDPPVVYSTDGGVTFEPRATGLPPASASNRIGALFMRRADPLYLEVIYEDGKVWETFDGGLLWTLRYSLPFSSPGFADADWDEASGHVFVSRDGVVSSHPLYVNDGLYSLSTTKIHWDPEQSTLLVGTEYAGLWHQTIASSVDAPSVTDVPSPVLTLNLSPNPTTDLTTVTFRVPEGGAHVSAVVVDATGRTVLRMVDAPLPAGERHLIWDGCAENGERAAAGVYFVRVRAGEAEAKGKVVLIR